MTTFDARVVTARKPHTCMACQRPISAGTVYIAYPGKNSEGKFVTTHLCVECSYLLTRKSGANAHTVREGEFTDQLIPNCLRKLRTAFRQNPKQAIRDAGLDRIEQKDAVVKRKEIKRLIVRKIDYDKNVFHFPADKRHYAGGFVPGNSISIHAGVSGNSRMTTIAGVSSKDGMIELLTADVVHEITQTQQRKLKDFPFLLLPKSEAGKFKPGTVAVLKAPDGSSYTRRVYAVQPVKKQDAAKYGAKSDVVAVFIPENEE